ncbi:MAG: type II and III secretion system protein family protein [Bryobacteraceae bacterium]
MRAWGRVSVVLAVLVTVAGFVWAGEVPTVAMEMTVGQGQVIDCPSELARISTTDPAVVDTVAVSRQEVLLQAKGAGQATVGIWLKDGSRRLYRVEVGYDLEPLRKLLRQNFPGEEIEVAGGREAIALSGRVSAQAVAERAAALAAPFGKSVVNNLSVPPPAPERQVLLRVRFAELNQSAAVSLGANLISTGAANVTGRVTTGQFPAPEPGKITSASSILEGVTGTVPGRTASLSNFTLSDALNIFAFRPDINLGAFIQALRTQGVLQILAEPNLVAIEGKEASFLVGGEFPVPVVQGGANVGAVTVSFREFGIRLTFQPEVTTRKTIKLKVKPEVSTIDMANAVTLSGFLIPALATRRVETQIELAEGQSFVIAGLLDDRVTENLARMPGLSQIPVLGALFRSRQEKKSKTELVVIVTPSIAEAEALAGTGAGPTMPLEFLAPGTEGGERQQNKQRQQKR